MVNAGVEEQFSAYVGEEREDEERQSALRNNRGI